MSPLFVDVRRQQPTPALPDRPRHLQGGGGDGDRDDPPVGFVELISVIQEWCRDYGYRQPPLWTRVPASEAATDAVHRIVPTIVLALIQDPSAEERIREAAHSRLPLSGGRPSLRASDHWNIDLYRHALDRDPEERPGYRLHYLSRAVEYAVQRLTQAEAAQLAGLLARQVALSTGRPKETHVTVDAASARLQLVADAFTALDYTEQQIVTALVAATANATPSRPKLLRAAARRFLAHVFGAEDLASLAKDCINLIVRKQRAEEPGD